jgi:holo-[acyl-carrier protein] synthase
MSQLSLAEHAAVAVDELAWKAGVRAGCDVIDVPHFKERLARTPALRQRIFSEQELADAARGDVEPGSDVEIRRLAARAAAKEAAYKAFAMSGLRFRDVEVVTDEAGAPHLTLFGQWANASVSLSHDGDVAMAVVISTPDADVPNPLDLHRL